MQRHLPIILLILLTLLAYARVTQCGFVSLDDQVYVTENPQVRRGLTREGIAWAATTPLGAYWHPLTWLSLMVDAQVGGPDNPAVFHATNLLLHLGNTILVYLVLRAMTGEPGVPWRSALVAGLFAVHPLRVESVAWIAERKDVLSSFLGLLALWFYVAYARRGGWWRYALVLLWATLSLMAKPMLVTLPGLLLLLDYWPLGRLRGVSGGTALPGGVSGSESQDRPDTGRKPGATRPGLARLILEKIPLVVIAVVFSLATVIIQKHEGAQLTTAQLPLSLRLSNAVVSYVRYLGKMVWPASLSVSYPMPDHWAAPVVAACAALLLGITVLVLWRGRRWPWLPVGWLWFLGTMLPVIGIIQPGDQAMADRYAYLTTIGLLVMLVWSIPDRWVGSVGGRNAVGACAAAVLAALAACTWVQVGHWRDSRALFTNALAVTQRNAPAEIGLALVLSQEGDDAGARDHLLKALSYRPDDGLAMNNLALVLEDLGDRAGAMKYLVAALQRDPDSPEANLNMGNALAAAGHMDDAIACLRKAIKRAPFMDVAWNNLGLALASQKKTEEAIAAFTRAAQLRPDNLNAHFNLGVALNEAGRPAEAAAEFRRALAIDPNHVPAHLRLAETLEHLGQVDQAAAEYRRVLKIEPNNAEARRGAGGR